MQTVLFQFYELYCFIAIGLFPNLTVREGISCQLAGPSDPMVGTNLCLYIYIFGLLCPDQGCGVG